MKPSQEQIDRETKEDLEEIQRETPKAADPAPIKNEYSDAPYSLVHEAKRNAPTIEPSSILHEANTEESFRRKYAKAEQH